MCGATLRLQFYCASCPLRCISMSRNSLRYFSVLCSKKVQLLMKSHTTWARVFPPLQTMPDLTLEGRARSVSMEECSVRRSSHRSVSVAVADGRGLTTAASIAHTPSTRASVSSRFGRMSMALLAAASLAVATFVYIASAAQRTGAALGTGRWWPRGRAQGPLAAKAPPPAAPTTVTIGDVLLGQTSPVSFTCVDLDWWPETKCDYGRCTWARSSMLTIDLDDRRLRAALRALSPRRG